MMRRTTVQSETGMVSLFLVIFSALLITIVTVAFVRIMIQTQQQATANDLSKSALDSAYAGVEDAKRAIVAYKTQCMGDHPTGSVSYCHNISTAFTDQQCNTIQKTRVAGNPGDSEVQVQQSTDDNQLDQAYTCVKVQLDTYDYLANITSGNSRLIHLKSNGPFTKVTIEWYSQQDLQASLGNNPASDKVNLLQPQTPLPLPKLSDWAPGRPALMRVQLMQYDKASGFTLSNLSQKDGSGTNTANNASLFLYPVDGMTDANGVDTASLGFADDPGPQQTTTALQQVHCDNTFSTTAGKGMYACAVTINLLPPIGTTDPADPTRDAYLLVDELYNTSTHFRVTMQDNSAHPILFNAVQPAVDSTGRANDLFRRISSRIDLEDSNIPNTETAVDITGSLCKTFTVTNDPTGYSSGLCKDGSTFAPN